MVLSPGPPVRWDGSHLGLLYVGMGVKELLYLSRVDVLSSTYNHVLYTSHYTAVPKPVQTGYVTVETFTVDARAHFSSVAVWVSVCFSVFLYPSLAPSISFSLHLISYPVLYQRSLAIASLVFSGSSQYSSITE